MSSQTPNPQTIFHLRPVNNNAKKALTHPDNKPYVSPCGLESSLEIGYHVSTRTSAEVIATIGRNADLILPCLSISQIQFSFEIHPRSLQIIFCDRSRYSTTEIKPYGFSDDVDFRQIILIPETTYRIGAGGTNKAQYIFDLVWFKGEDKAIQTAKRGYQIAKESRQLLRYARTVEDTTELPARYKTRLHTDKVEAVQSVLRGELLGEGAFGKVYKGFNIDSGRLIAIKEIRLSPGQAANTLQRKTLLWREVKTMSSISHNNIVEYLGSSDLAGEAVEIYMGLKAGSMRQLLEKMPEIKKDNRTLQSLLSDMLKALDYLAFRGLCHRDVKLENILYTPAGNRTFLFQLGDFGLANQQRFATTFCGTSLYIAPEVKYGKPPQTPKLDVWSLFITMAIVTEAGELHKADINNYQDVLARVRVATTILGQIEPMAREDPDFRASAAQMLVKLFKGRGLSTPRRQVRPIREV